MAFYAVILPKLLVLFCLLSIIDRIDTQYGKLIVQGKNEAPPHEKKPIARKFFIPMRTINQRSESVEKNEKSHLIQKLPPILNLDKNRSASGQHLTLSEGKNSESTIGTETNDRSNPANTFKAVSLLAHLHSMSLANDFQSNARQHDKGYNKENGAIDIENKNSGSQKHNDVVDNQYHNTGKSHLNMRDISEIDNFTLKLKKLIEKSVSGALRRNPRHGHPYDLKQNNHSPPTYAQNETSTNDVTKDGKELKITGTMSVEYSSEFANSSDFRSSPEPKTESGQENGVSLKKKQSASSNTSIDNITENVFGEQLNGNITNETVTMESYSENNEDLDSQTREPQIKIDDDNITDDFDQDGIKEVSILSNNYKEKIIYASKSLEEEPEKDESDFQNNAPMMDFKRARQPSVKILEKKSDKDDVKMLKIASTQANAAGILLYGLHPVLIFPLLKNLISSF
ncbi:unnamed protein product [Cercopithifilaria johnstoni]|uniref:Uncharacterized protein n=1 Tax=Cercopithifilaria johnstoni TaxID=2874296 RepID=A0A8J2LSB2_9BILA|nr:unnamed protein product [Cercopithifilaria johnstoni]